jgi:hypothetical protein
LLRDATEADKSKSAESTEWSWGNI